MLAKSVLDVLNEQLTIERHNEAVYKCASAALKNIAWDGFAAFCDKQASGEAKHAAMIQNYLVDRGHAPVYAALDAIPTTTVSLRDGFRQLYDLELATTSHLKECYFVSETADDPQTCIFLQPLLTEQVEEEKTLSDLVAQLWRATDNASLLVLDGRYGG